MKWAPLKFSVPLRFYAFGGTLIGEKLGKIGIPSGLLAETWELSDWGASSTLENTELAGRSLRDLVREHPRELVGAGFTGERFPLLAKFLDASHMLPVHLHANDETARRKYAEPNGKTEAWHILWAAPGASIRCGVHPGVTKEQLRQALLEQRYDDVMPRYPIQAGDTVYVPGGVLHSFGPNTLIYEIQQTSDLGVNAMPRDLHGQELSQQEWERNVDDVLDEIILTGWPQPNPGLVIEAEAVRRRFCCASKYFALERIEISGEYERSFDQALIASNVGGDLAIHFGDEQGVLPRAETRLLPAALGSVRFEGNGELLLAYVPQMERDVWAPLRVAGYPDEAIRRLVAVP